MKPIIIRPKNNGLRGEGRLCFLAASTGRGIAFAILLLSLGLQTVAAAPPLTNKPERLEWLKDAGFGMFVHWSVDSQLGSVISHSLTGASDDHVSRFFEELPTTFNPKKFDPEEWVVLAKLAGMKYLVFTTRHYSGFCMWDTKTTDFDIMNTPYGKDIFAEVVKACRKHGLGVGVYYGTRDFWYLHKHGIGISGAGPGAKPDPSNPAYVEYMKEQIRELTTNYGKIDVVFFDGSGSEPLKEVVWKSDPDILVTRGAIRTPEQAVLPGIPGAQAWEACITMGTQWQYKPTNETYKSGTRLIEILIETRAKGGALLLNVGPKPNGELPIEQEERLREIALWNFVNQEATHDVRPWIVTNEGDIWYTRTQDTVYAFITKLPFGRTGTERSFVLKTVQATERTSVEILGQSGRWNFKNRTFDGGLAPEWQQKEDGLHVSATKTNRVYQSDLWPNPVVLKISHAAPAFTPPVFETEDAGELAGGSAVLNGRIDNLGDAKTLAAGFRFRKYPGFGDELNHEEWSETETTEVSKTGIYHIRLSRLEAGELYQYQAMIKHPKVTLFGNVVRFTAR